MSIPQNRHFYFERPVRQPLSRFIEKIWIVDGIAQNGRGHEWVVIPDGRIDLIMRIKSDGQATLDLNGLPTKLVKDANERVGTMVAVTFRPAGAFPFFQFSMGDLCNQVISVFDQWRLDCNELLDSLERQHGRCAVLDRLEQLLAARLSRSRSLEPSLPLIRALHLIEQGPLPLTVSGLSHASGLSERQLRRKFETVVGVSPKLFLRINRFQRAIKQIRARLPEEICWSDLAIHTGYFDQSHLIQDFQEFTNQTPLELATSGLSL